MSRLERIIRLKSALGPTHSSAASWYLNRCVYYRPDVSTITRVHIFYPEKSL